MLRGKIFEKNEEIRIGGQICPLPVCLGLIPVPIELVRKKISGRGGSVVVEYLDLAKAAWV